MTNEAAQVKLEGPSGAKLSGELDVAAYETLCTALEPLFEATGDVTLDLSDVAFIDSSAIRLFVRMQRSRNGTNVIILSSPQPHVARVLAVAGVSELGIKIEGGNGAHA